jgi:DNA helicase-2/ATP-dependent DNA helicase PcrA
MTRAKNELHLIHPLRFYVHRQHRHGERHLYAPLSRFLPGAIANRFETTSHARGSGVDDDPGGGGAVRVDVAARLREMW